MRAQNNGQQLNPFWMLAAVMPFVAVWIADALVSAFTAKPYNFEGEFVPRLIRTFIVGSPFLLIVVWAKRKMRNPGDPVSLPGLRGAATAVAVATLLLWGWFTYDMIVSRGSFDIGIAVVLLLSPLYMAGLIMPGYHAGRWLHRKRNPAETPDTPAAVDGNNSALRWLLPAFILLAGIFSPIIPRLVVPVIAPGEYLDSLTRIFVDDPATGRAYLIWMVLPFLLLSLYCLSFIWDRAMKKEVFRSRSRSFVIAAVFGFVLSLYLNIPQTTPQAGQLTGIYYPVIIVAVMAAGWLGGIVVTRLSRKRTGDR